MYRARVQRQSGRRGAHESRGHESRPAAQEPSICRRSTLATLIFPPNWYCRPPTNGSRAYTHRQSPTHAQSRGKHLWCATTCPWFLYVRVVYASARVVFIFLDCVFCSLSSHFVRVSVLSGKICRVCRCDSVFVCVSVPARLVSTWSI